MRHIGVLMTLSANSSQGQARVAAYQIILLRLLRAAYGSLAQSGGQQSSSQYGGHMAVPEGYSPHFRKSPLIEPWEPLYSKQLPDRVVIGLEVRRVHCNSRGLAHGGLISALADNAM